MNQPLRVGIVGAGEVAARSHIPGFQAAGTTVVALCDKKPARLAEVADRYGIPRRYVDWREMLREGSVDAVSICTPTALHAQIAVRSAQYGCHVLVEKPMALSLSECDEMIRAADENGVLLMVSLNQRFAPPHVLAKQILDTGRLGRPYLVHATFGHGGPEVWSPNQEWYFHPELAGFGVLADLGFHKIDLIQWLLNQRVEQIAAYATTFEKNTPLDDTVVCTFRLSGGTLGTLQVSWVFHPDVENTLVIRCQRGVMRLPTDLSEPLRLTEIDAEGQPVHSDHVCQGEDRSGRLQAITAFVRAVQEGLPSPVPGVEGHAVLAVLLTAYAAAAGERLGMVSL